MAALAFAALLVLAMAGPSSANWCVCKTGVSDGMLQKAIDYACGAGADCNPIKSTGACYNPNTVKSHCDYAVNSYFQKKGQGAGTCDFSGCAAPVTTDPSITGCVYPSTASSSTPVSTTPTTGTTPSTTTGTTPSTTTGTTPTTTTGTTPTTTTGTTPSTTTGTTTGTTPYTATPGVFGVGPSGAGINTDDSGAISLINTSLFSSFTTLFLSGLMLWWG